MPPAGLLSRWRQVHASAVARPATLRLAHSSLLYLPVSARVSARTQRSARACFIMLWPERSQCAAASVPPARSAVRLYMRT